MHPSRYLAVALAITTSAWATAQVGPWPMERQDRWGSGMSLSSPSPSRLIPGYIEKVLDVYIVSNPPSLGPNNTGYFGDWVNDQLFTIDYRSATILHQFKPATPNFIISTPAILGPSEVLFSTDAPTTGELFAFNPITQTVLWKKTMGAISASEYQHVSPIIGPGGDILACNRNGDVFRWKPDGTEVWHVTGYTNAWHTMAFSRDDSTVFLSNGNHMSAIRYSDGGNIWTKNYGTFVGGPAVSPTGTLVFGIEGGTVYNVDPATGNTLWFRPVGGAVRAAPGFDDRGNVFMACLDKKLYSLKMSSGAVKWTFTTDSVCEEPATIDSNGRIYIQPKSGKVYAVNQLGGQSWVANVVGEPRGPMTISPDGTLFAGFTSSAGSGVAVIRQIQPPIDKLQLTKSSVYGGGSTNGNLFLAFTPPSGGATIQLSSSDPAAASVPASTTIPVHQSTGSFNITAGDVANQEIVKISATYGGITRIVSLVVRPSQLYSVSAPTSIIGGDSAIGQVRYIGSPGSDRVVSLSSSNSTLAKVASSVTLPAHTSSVAFSITTFGVSVNSSITITATADGVTKSTLITLRPAPLVAVDTFSDRLKGGNSTTGVVRLKFEAGPSTNVSLSSNDPDVQVPTSVTVPYHMDGATFSVTTSAVAHQKTVTITATLGTWTRTTTLVLTP